MVSVLRPGQRHIMIPGIGVTTSRRAVQQPAPPAGMHVEDSFTAANGTSLNGRTPDVANTPGNTWVAALETWTIINGRARGTDYNLSYLIIDCGVADCTITMPVGRDNNANGIVFRYVDNSNLWLLWYTTNSGLILYEQTAGAFTSRASAAENTTDIATATIVLSGNDISANFYGHDLSYSSAVRATATKHGIGRQTSLDSGVAEWWKAVS